VEGLVHAAHGSVFDTITTVTLQNARIIDAGPEVAKAYEEKARPLYDRVLANQEENTTLAALRDLLLPKLLSGEIRIKDAEKVVGDAT
jgi:type I restriction enzyme S subunit